MIPDFGGAIFTSRAGVSFASAGLGRTAWCVGKATADAAGAKGYEPVSSLGDVGDLVRLILSERPRDSLLHVRGEVVRGNVTSELIEAGLTCKEVIAYRKSRHHMPDTARAQLKLASAIIIPAFFRRNSVYYWRMGDAI